jgi:hypothetical protein
LIGGVYVNTTPVLSAIAVLLLGSCFAQSGSGQKQAKLEQSQPSEDIVIILERHGGYAGVHEKFEIYRDGTVSDANGTTRRIPMTAMEAILREAKALELRKRYPGDLPRSMCSDCFQYRITIRDHSGQIVLNIHQPQMDGRGSNWRLAQDIRNLVLGLGGEDSRFSEQQKPKSQKEREK